MVSIPAKFEVEKVEIILSHSVIFKEPPTLNRLFLDLLIVKDLLMIILRNHILKMFNSGLVFDEYFKTYQTTLVYAVRRALYRAH